MPTFRRKPVMIDAHRIRYEDMYGEPTDTPDWFQDRVDSGELVAQSAGEGSGSEGFVIVHPDGARHPVKMGNWVGVTPFGRLVALDNEALAEEYELVG